MPGQTPKRDDVFEQWLSDHKGLILKVVRIYAAAAEDQDDLFQEILLQLWRSIPAFREESKASTWLYKVALHTALAWKRTGTKHIRSNQTAIRMHDVITFRDDPSATLEKQGSL